MNILTNCDCSDKLPAGKAVYCVSLYILYGYTCIILFCDVRHIYDSICKIASVVSCIWKIQELI